MRYIREMRAMVFALTALAVTGCKVDGDPTLYISDLRDAASGAEGLFAPTIITIETASASECPDVGPQIAEALSRYYSDPDFIGCAGQYSNDEARIRIDVPIVKIEYDKTFANELPITVLVMDEPNSKEHFLVGTYFNLDRANEVITLLGDDFSSMMGHDFDLTINATVVADEREASKITIQSAFVDGSPYPSWENFDMDRRDELRVRLSDVAAEKMRSDGDLVWLAVRKRTADDPVEDSSAD